MIQVDPRNREVIFSVINGREINSAPDQTPQRSVINFHDWSEEKARTYPEPFRIVEELVKPVRSTQNRPRNRDVWWIYAEHRPGLTAALRPLQRCFVAAVVTKYLNFSIAPADIVFTHKLYVFATDRWDLYAVVQSTLHEVWARKYSGTLETRLNYSPSDCFETFPFPLDLWQTPNPALAEIGKRYHEHRRALMLRLWLGLTDLYNVFHTRDLTPTQVAKVSKKSAEEAEAGYQGILELRNLHRQLDQAIRDAYGWIDLDIGHDFHEVETLPENDRVRYTISPTARKEVLKLLLAENHRRAALEASASATVATAKKPRARKTKPVDQMGDLFVAGAAVPPVSTAESIDVQAELSRLADHAWERPGTDQVFEESAVLAAILKAKACPAPKRDIRLAALLAMRPRLLLASLAPEDASQWRRLVGPEAEPLASGVSMMQPAADHAWGHAVKGLLGRGRMIEDPATQTWAPGEGLDTYVTEGWPEGRVGMVLRTLSQRGVERVVATLSATDREWLDVLAA